MNIVFLGPPGSGKGTQAQKITEELGFRHLSTGDVFRAAIQNKTPLGVKIKEFVDSGKLVPDSLVSEVVFEDIKAGNNKSGVLLDGYPRTVEQAAHLDKFSKDNGFRIDAILFFDVKADVLVKRLSARRQCPKCKEVYNLEKRPPKNGKTCDSCGTELVQRPDDKADVVQERLRIYEKQTEPILNTYKDRAEFSRINADQEINKVYGELQGIVCSKKQH